MLRPIVESHVDDSYFEGGRVGGGGGGMVVGDV